MTAPCGNFKQLWCLATLAICVVAFPARAELAEEVSQFLSDYDRLNAQFAALAADRAQMAVSLASGEQLRQAVRSFFNDRAEIAAIRLLKATDRRDMRVALNYAGAKLTKPTAGSGDLALDAASYIANYDAWQLQQALVAGDIAAMRQALSNGDPTELSSATTSFFDNARLRLQKRLQWQADIRALKKDVSFKGTGKASAPSGQTLSDFVSAFLSDRAAWEAKGLELEADRDSIRSALNGTGLQEAVLKFLSTRRAKVLLGRELYLDREAMRLQLGGARIRERKLGAEFTARDIDADEETGALEESAEVAGEK